MTIAPERFQAALREAGIPDGFSVVHAAQLIPRTAIREIERFIGVFERVTTRPSWQRTLTADAPPWARGPRGEACFFSAWDFHLPDDGGDWQLIEVNDNGSGFLFAAIINATYAELSSLASDPRVDASPGLARFRERLLEMIEQEARRFYGRRPNGLFFILDDADSLARGHFRGEHELLAALVRTRGWDTAIGGPETLAATGGRLQHGGRDVSFVVNRSTDFLWQGDAFGPLRECFAASTVYVAPNPFTYLTRSDKRTLELLSHPDRDDELGIAPDERAALAAHVPETMLLRESNVDELARRKHELFFKPAHGYASHGTLASSEVGRARLRRLLRAGEPYVAQCFVPKRRLSLPGGDEPLRTDLRVWAYRGEPYLLSGRATRSEGRLDLRSGGWIPTFVIDESPRESA